MSLTATEIRSKSAGDVYLAPLGTGAPTDEAALVTIFNGTPGAWVHAGWLHEDGPEISGFAPESTAIPGWNRQAPARYIFRFGEPEITVPLLQWNAENLALYFPGATHDAVNGVLSIPDVASPVAQELLIIVRDGTEALGLWVASVQPAGGDDLSFPGDGASVIPVSMKVLSPASGPMAKLVGVAVAA